MELSRGRGTAHPQHELAEQVFAALVGDTAVGFAVLDADLRYVTLNELLAGINGLPVEEHIGRALSDVLPHLAPSAEEPFREVLRTGRPLADLQFSGTFPSTGGARRHWAGERLPRPGPRRGGHRRRRARVGGHGPGGVPAAP